MLISRLLDGRVVTGLFLSLALTAYTSQAAHAEESALDSTALNSTALDSIPLDRVANVIALEVSVDSDDSKEASCEEGCAKESCDKEGCDGTACDADGCASEAPEGEVCETEACETKASETTGQPDAEANKNSLSDQIASTHHQTAIIKIHVDDLPKTALKTFCLTATGDLLAACGDDTSGDVRHFSPTGELLTSWELPFAPEAINVGSDGRVYAAGEGKLARFTLDGEVVNEGTHPFGEVTEERREELRKEVIASHKSQREWMTEYLGDLDSQIETIEKRLGIEKESEAADTKANADEEGSATLTAISDVKVEVSTEDDSVSVTAGEISLETSEVDQEAKVAAEEEPKEESPAEIAKRQRDELMLKSLLSQQEMYQRMVDQQGEEELTEEQIEEKVKASLAYKMKVASISEADGEVFIATGASKGYGFSVWRMNRRFESGEQIVDKLSGCCGQMDVQACDGGIYVAENSRHKVRCFDRQGEEVRSWGSSAREGLTGFGSCCNPMNVAFGPERSVYTAESGTGRIKQYSPDGKLLGLVGKADLVPGCKKVSIAVGPAGDRVYMLDITRNHVVMLERISEEEQVAYYEKDLSKGYPEPDGAFASFFRTMGKAMAGSN